MKKFASQFLTIAITVLSIGFTAPLTASAATTPSLGAAATYAVLSSTYTNTTAGTTITGDVGFTTGPAVAPLGAHANYGSGVPYANAGADQGAALSSLNAQPCTFNFAGGAIDLSTDTTHGTIGVYSPGVYCSSGAMNIGGPLSLNGNGTYIFRSAGALTSTAGASVSLNGASACDVFWTPAQATTLAANTTFQGNVIADAGITVGANTTWTGRALSFAGTATTDTVTLNVPSCSIPVVITPVVITATTTAVVTASTTPPIVSVPITIGTTTVTVINGSLPPASVIIPGFPTTGLPPKTNTSLLNIFLLLSGIVLFGTSAILVSKKVRV
jgi:hypothetical protein